MKSNVMTMLRRIVSLSLVAAALTPALAAHGAEESLESVEYWKTQDGYLKDTLNSTNSQCGTNITYTWVNKEDFRKKATAHNNSPYGICSDILSSLSTICYSGDEAKKRVQAKVKTLACGYANPHTMSLSGGKLTLMSNQEQPNFDDWALPELRKAL